jgi:hypothetical protein
MGKALFRRTLPRGGPRGVAAGSIDFVLSYRRPPPRAIGYRTQREVSIGDLLDALRALGYAPRARTCNDLAEVVGPADDDAALLGAHLEIDVARCRGHIRVQLPDPGAPEPGAQRLGELEIRGGPGSAAEELGLFALRALAGLLDELEAARGDSALAPVAVPLLTAALPERPERLG